MKSAISMILFAAVAVASAVAHADTRTLQLWTCTINTNKTMAEVQAANTKWLKFVNGKVKGGDIRSSVLRPVTSGFDQFMFVDSFPSIEAWAAQQTAMTTPEGIALEAEFNALFKCTSGNLFSSTES